MSTAYGGCCMMFLRITGRSPTYLLIFLSAEYSGTTAVLSRPLRNGNVPFWLVANMRPGPIEAVTDGARRMLSDRGTPQALGAPTVGPVYRCGCQTAMAGGVATAFARRSEGRSGPFPTPVAARCGRARRAADTLAPSNGQPCNRLKSRSLIRCRLSPSFCTCLRARARPAWMRSRIAPARTRRTIPYASSSHPWGWRCRCSPQC